MKGLCMLVALSLLAISCDNDDNGNKDKNPEPSSVTLLDSQVTMAADGTFTVNFRVEPTNYVVTKDAVGLITTTWGVSPRHSGQRHAGRNGNRDRSRTVSGNNRSGRWVAHCKMNSTTGFEWAGMKLTVYTYDKNHNLQAATEAPGTVSVLVP